MRSRWIALLGLIQVRIFIFSLGVDITAYDMASLIMSNGQNNKGENEMINYKNDTGLTELFLLLDYNKRVVFEVECNINLSSEELTKNRAVAEVLKLTGWDKIPENFSLEIKTYELGGVFYLVSKSSGELVFSSGGENKRHVRRQYEALTGQRFNRKSLNVYTHGQVPNEMRESHIKNYILDQKS